MPEERASMGFDYIYEEQSQQFLFYKIPKELFTNERFQAISTEGKVLYGLLLDRVSLSIENQWIDDNGRVYIIYTLAAICAALRCSEKSAIKYMAELEDIGLVERIRQGFGKPTLIYVKNFMGQKKLQVNSCNNYSYGAVEFTGQELENLQSNNTNYNNTDFNNTNPILSEDEERIRYETHLKQQLNVPVLKKEYPTSQEMIDGMVELILDVLCSKNRMIRIAGEDKPINVVKSRFMKLNIEHMRYVVRCFQLNTTKIRSIKQYMLAALYNAPATMKSYYQAEVNYDMATGKI